MRASYSLGSLLSVFDVLSCVDAIRSPEPDTVWIPETWGVDSFSMMSTLSSRLSSRLGSSIVNIYSRSPTLIAMSAATVNSISQGRLLLGLGTSSLPIVEDLHGLKFEKPLLRMSEYIDIIRLALSGSKITFDGEFFHLKNFKLLTKPQNIPIYVAAINDKMVKLAWNKADGIIFYLRPLSELSASVDKLQKTRQIDVACQIITCVSDDAEKAIVRGKKTLAFYIAVGSIYRKFLSEHGYDVITCNIYDEYQRTGLSNIHELIPDSMLSDLAICGTPQTCLYQISRFTNAGITHPILQFNPVDNTRESFKLFSSTFSGELG